MNTQAAEEQPDLDGCTFHGVPVEEHIKDEDTKTTQSVYADEIKEKSNPNPVRSKSRFTTPKERNGKAMSIKNRLYNDEVGNNYSKCETVKQLVISLLLSGVDLTVSQLAFRIKEASDWHKGVRNIIGTGSGTYFKIQSVYNALNSLARSNLSKLMQVRKITNQSRGIGQKKIMNCYSIDTEERNITFEEAVELSKEWPRKKVGIPKKTIKKAVKNQKTKREHQEMKSMIEKELKNMMEEFLLRGGEAMEKQYKDVLEAMNKELDSLRELVNEALMNTPAKKLSTSFDLPTGIESIIPQTIKIDVPTNFHFHFGFSVVDKDGKVK